MPPSKEECCIGTGEEVQTSYVSPSGMKQHRDGRHAERHSSYPPCALRSNTESRQQSSVRSYGGGARASASSPLEPLASCPTLAMAEDDDDDEVENNDELFLFLTGVIGADLPLPLSTSSSAPSVVDSLLEASNVVVVPIADPSPSANFAYGGSAFPAAVVVVVEESPSIKITLSILPEMIRTSEQNGKRRRNGLR